jgi:hypothetical protein
MGYLACIIVGATIGTVLMAIVRTGARRVSPRAPDHCIACGAWGASIPATACAGPGHETGCGAHLFVCEDCDDRTQRARRRLLEFEAEHQAHLDVPVMAFRQDCPRCGLRWASCTCPETEAHHG